MSLNTRDVFEIQWFLLVFAFWPHQKTDFEAFERNKDASHALTVRKLILYSLRIIRVAAVLACASQNRFLKTKKRGGERRRGETENNKKEGGREEKVGSGASKQPPIMARA